MGQEKILTDSEVVDKVLTGDNDAFSLIVERYQKGLVNYIYHMVHQYDEALELTQEVFLKSYTGLKKYDRQYKFSTWIYKIASNHTIDHMRRQRPDTTPIQTRADGNDVHEIPLESQSPSPQESLQRKRLRREIVACVKSLPPAYRELIILRHFNFRSYEEIAKITGLPLGTVKNRIFRARRMLMEQLQDAR